MYTYGIYKAFVQLRKQLYKLKTRKSLDRYSKIEYYKNEYKTFRRFCDEVDEYYAEREYYGFDKMENIQETFEKLIELSQKNQLKYVIY